MSAAELQQPEPQQILLWERNVPNALGNEEKDKPKTTVWFPDIDKSVGTAIVVCPGGGYGNLAMDHEGKQIAEWFNSFGVTAAVLDYRHRSKGYGHPNPLLDVQRAIRIVRLNAKAWNIDPAQIGVIGFSAGGHLASTAAVHSEDHPKGNADWNYSAPHGAGRVMSRSAAKKTITLTEYEKAMEGVFSTTVNRVTIDEAPFAYKSMQEVIENSKDTMTIVKTIKPLYNFKAGQE